MGLVAGRFILLRNSRPALRYIFVFLKKKHKGCRYDQG